MSNFAREYLAMRDGRNPYGSRGGYVTSHDPRRRRDRDSEDNNDYNRRNYSDDYARRDDRRNSSQYSQSDYARNDRDYERSEQSRDYYSNYPIRERDGDEMYDRRDDRRDYGYKEPFGVFSHKDIEYWKHSMENEDGTRGEHFTKEQIEQMARQYGIDLGDVDPTIFCLEVNKEYSDICQVAKKYGVNRIEYYIDMAKAFFKDKDVHWSPEEKLWRYYKFIVEDKQ